MDIRYLLKVLLICAVCVMLIDAKPKKEKKRKKAKKRDPVDFTVLKNSVINKAKKSSDGLPSDVTLNFDVLGESVQLTLKRNPKVKKVNDIYVIRKSKSGIPVIVQQDLIDNEVFGEYQDVKNSAIFTIRCPKENLTVSGNCDATMEGTFRSRNEEFRMQLMDDSAVHRVRREAGANTNLWKRAKTLISAANAFSKVYGIFKSENSPITPTDFQEAAPITSRPVSAAFGTEAKIVREDVLPGDQLYNVEILAIVDYSLYERFYKASKAGSETEKDTEAKLNIKKYFSHVFNGVDMLYQNIDDREFGLSVAVSGFIIADSAELSPWTTPHKETNPEGRDTLLVQTPLDALISWTFSARNIPENDHVMLLTDYDLYSMDGGTVDLRTAGYARVGSICSLDSVSVVEDHGGFQSINAAAHELGHSLGARHDGNQNTCDGMDQFVMTANGGFETDATRTNPWQFSACSVNYFKRTISNLPSFNCLSDPVEIYDEQEFLDFVSNYPGQHMDPNQQCQDILGLESFYGWGTELGTYSKICTEMSCSLPGSSRSYRVYKAATGTSCGDKQWCIEGQCVFDQRAPTKNPSCPFGDIQRLFGSNRQSCREYMLDRPMRCYDDFYSNRCCDTCEKLNTGVRGCEFGDKFLGCSASGCFDPSYAESCCSTCGLAPFPVIRDVITTTTTTAKPTTSRPMTPRPTTPKPTTPRPTTPRPTTTKPTTTSRPTPTTTKATTTKRPATPRPTTQRPTVTSRPVTTSRPPVTSRPTRPVTSRPTTTSRPPTTTIAPQVETEKPTSSDPSLQPSGTSGLCLRLDARFLLVFRCSSMTSLFGADACDNSLISRYCCEKCPAPGEPACIDSPTCQIQYSRECYIDSRKEACCKTCQRFETGVQGCEYGDRIRSCSRYYAQLGGDLVCGQYRKYCCAFCDSINYQPESNVMSLVDPNPVIVETGNTVRSSANDAGTVESNPLSNIVLPSENPIADDAKTVVESSSGNDVIHTIFLPSRGRIGSKGKGRGNQGKQRGRKNNRGRNFTTMSVFVTRPRQGNRSNSRNRPAFVVFNNNRGRGNSRG